uniref:Uncharacterized protein n=1 Tax=Siphoviridae sp. ctZro7 TaxID=2825561 RepID=A0A8S5PPT6_9CAUD|nr:MAG TPA: hypothetical protein [Siphoviridae sp. ctZro7]
MTSGLTDSPSLLPPKVTAVQWVGIVHTLLSETQEPARSITVAGA